MCTNTNNYVPVRRWFDDEDEEEQWGYGYKDDMKAQFKEELYNKRFILQDQSKDDPIVTLENRIKFWIHFIVNDEGPISDNLYDYDCNNEELDHSVHGAEIIPERREF